MDSILVKSLHQLGCSDKHIRFYRANLELGAVPLSEITAAARLQRSTSYLIANDMVAMGLALEDHKTYKKLYVAAEPQVILRKLEAKQRLIGRNSLAFKEVLPDLQALHQATTTRPHVRTYEGQAGIIAFRKDILAVQQEVLVWTDQEAEQRIFDSQTHEAFVLERIARDIPIRVLAVDNEPGRKLTSGKAVLRTVRLLPPEVQFTSETYIYGNKVAVLDAAKQSFGVITENEQIAASQRAIFEFAWHAAAIK